MENDRKKKLNYYKQLFTILFRRQQLNIFSGFRLISNLTSQFSLYANIEINNNNNEMKNPNLKTWLSQTDLNDPDDDNNSQKKIRSCSETKDVMYSSSSSSSSSAVVVKKTKKPVSRFKFSELMFRLFDFNYF